MKTVAIVGSQEETRGNAPWDDLGVDIWVFNEAASQSVKNGEIVGPWVRRCEAVLQMHTPVVYRNPENRSDKEHWSWLQRPHPFPIYMQDADPDVPASTRYPFEGVRALSGNVTLFDEQIEFFTSSIVYAIALAIYQGYERILLYGIEMASNTEYIYQRDGITLWAGIAISRGIQFWVPADCSMLMAPRYGYDDSLHGLTWEDMDGYATAIIPKLEETSGKLKEARGRMEGIQTELAEAMQRGDPREIQEATGKRYEDAVNDYEQKIADYAHLHGQYMFCRNLQMRIGKQLEYDNQAQKVIALNDMMKPR
jgi:hypothetical protein